eukprot:scaffold176837_cov31-Attheya_sp.AAC.1
MKKRKRKEAETNAKEHHQSMETSTSPHFAASQHRHPLFRNLFATISKRAEVEAETGAGAEAEAEAQTAVKEEAKSFTENGTMKTGTGEEEEEEERRHRVKEEDMGECRKDYS